MAFPTETVYGLGALATDPAAVARIYAAKGRPPDHPLIVHLAAADELARWAAEVPESAARLAAALWPGPLTIVLRRVAPAAARRHRWSGHGRPARPRPPRRHPAARAGRAAGGGPLRQPLRAGQPDDRGATCVADLGSASTSSSTAAPAGSGWSPRSSSWWTGRRPCCGPAAFPPSSIEAVLGAPLRTGDVGPARASGMLPSHYAPGCRVELVTAGQVAARPVRCWPRAPGWRCWRRARPRGWTARPVWWSCRSAPSVEEAARTLYRRLREADEAGADVLLAVPPPPEGLGLAVADRLAPGRRSPTRGDAAVADPGPLSPGARSLAETATRPCPPIRAREAAPTACTPATSGVVSHPDRRRLRRSPPPRRVLGRRPPLRARGDRRVRRRPARRRPRPRGGHHPRRGQAPLEGPRVAPPPRRRRRRAGGGHRSAPPLPGGARAEVGEEPGAPRPRGRPRARSTPRSSGWSRWARPVVDVHDDRAGPWVLMADPEGNEFDVA